MNMSRIFAALAVAALLAAFTGRAAADVCHEYRNRIAALEAAYSHRLLTDSNAALAAGRAAVQSAGDIAAAAVRAPGKSADQALATTKKFDLTHDDVIKAVTKSLRAIHDIQTVLSKAKEVFSSPSSKIHAYKMLDAIHAASSAASVARHKAIYAATCR